MTFKNLLTQIQINLDRQTGTGNFNYKQSENTSQH